jgi:hypothetical protein
MLLKMVILMPSALLGIGNHRKFTEQCLYSLLIDSYY